MPARRVNPFLVKLHRSYAVGELAERLGVHKNTVRQWQRDGLEPIDRGRPVLFQGAAVRAILTKRNAARRRPCPPGTFYCLRCRTPRPPAGGMVDFLALNARSGNLRAICGTCDAFMHRRAGRDGLATVMPGLAVQMGEAPQRLVGSPSPSPNCELEEQGTEP